MNLKEYLTEIESSSDFSYAMRNFLDDFYVKPSSRFFNDAPEQMIAKLDDDGLADAWIAATVGHLCQMYDLTEPRWMHENGRVMRKPWFAAKSPKLKAVLLQESPSAFRVRNLFVSANVLSRA